MKRSESKSAITTVPERLLSLSGVAMLLALATAFGLPVSASAAVTPRVFHVRDYGAQADDDADSGQAIRAAIQAAIDSGPGAEVVLDEGVYRVKPLSLQHTCFNIRLATNLVVRGAGKGTKIVVTEPTSGGFGFGLCQQITLRDMVIDYDPVPFCQGTIRVVDVQGGSFDFEGDADYSTPDADNFLKAVEPYGKWGMIIDPATRRIRAGTPDHYMTPRWEHREGRVWRFFTPDEHHRRNLQHMRVGDAYVHLARGHGSAVLAQGCDGVRIEDVTVHSSPGLAVGLVGNSGEILVRALRVRFPAGTDRLLTANADGVHCQQNRSGPIIEDCYFEGMADDAINLYTPPNVVREVRSSTQWLVSPGALIVPGDRLQVLDPKTGRLRGEVKAAGVQAEQRAILIRLDHALEGVVAGADHLTADTLYNLDACGAGFVIRRNHMNGNRRYGCLLRAGRGVVEDNIFEDTTGAGVVLANEPDWPEGLAPWGITIRRNRFLRGGTCLGYADTPHGAALAVRPARLGHGLAEAQAVRDLVIENNEFLDRAGTAIFVGGATNVAMRGNKITAKVEQRPSGRTVLVENSTNVTLVDPNQATQANRLTRVDEQGVLRWVDHGGEVALFGVNYYAPFSANCRDLQALGVSHKQVIDQDVAHFARLGLTAVRLHVFDREISTRQGDLVDNHHLELLDYLITQAARRGIYTVLTPIAWWGYGVPDDRTGFSGRFSMEQMTTDRTAWAAQARYLAQFVCHTNRFTGKSYREDPAVVAFELINEPLYPENTGDAQVVEYIDALADAVRGTGNRKPVFYNGWQDRLGCIRDARIEGASFGWYPSGLVAGRSLTRDFLPAVGSYGGDNRWMPSMRDPRIANKAKIVYEFDAADIPGSYIYPAMARSFRSGGAQIATQFQYDPLPLAPCNLGWQTHYLNLVYTPQKAVSFLIAAEAFRRLPRHQDYGSPPASDRFAGFRVSYTEDLSEMVTGREFLHSNTTRTQPPTPHDLERVVGCGSSPIVQYEGTGAYFLERLARGAWRLEVYPDAVEVDDPYGSPSPNREVSRLMFRSLPMQFRLPDLQDEFSVEPLNSGNNFRTSAASGRFSVQPGVYLLRRPGSMAIPTSDAQPAAIVEMDQFVVPAVRDFVPAIRHQSAPQWVQGVPLPMAFTIASSHEPVTALVHVGQQGETNRTTLLLKRDRAYHYIGEIPAALLREGLITYSLEVQTREGGPLKLTNVTWTLALQAANAPVALFDANRHKVHAQGSVPVIQGAVAGMTAGRRAWRVAVEKFGPPPSSVSLRNDVSDELLPWEGVLAARTTICVRARAAAPFTTTMEVVILERDGTPWGTNVALTTQWREMRLPLDTLRHFAHWGTSPAGRGGAGDQPQPGKLAAVSIGFGAWLYGHRAAECHVIELESVTVE